MGAHQIHHLVHVYGCWIVFGAAGLQALGAPVPGTTVLVAAALYAATAHGLPILGVIAAGAGGALVGTALGFVVGRFGGAPLLMWVGRRLRQSPQRVQGLRTEFARHGAAWVFIGRFITGIRNACGLLAGASGMGLSRFLLVSAAAAMLWSTVNALEYYFFGSALANASTWLQVVLICVGLIWMVTSVSLLRRRALRRLRRTSEWQTGAPPA
jgi:membrane protein DedA with SNARE-associated domain